MARLYEVTLIGKLFNQQIVNRWNYVSTDVTVPSTNAFGLVSAMGLIPTAGLFPVGTIGKAIQALANSSLVWSQVFCRAVYDPTDFLDLPYVPTAPGDSTSGQAMSPFIALGVRSNRVRLDIGRGYKRFAGVSEGDIDAGGTLATGVQTALNSLATLMGDSLTFTEGAVTVTYDPVIVKKFKYTTTSGKKAYRYYTTAEGGQTAQLANLAQGITWEAYTQVRSQTSRQYGKGS